MNDSDRSQWIDNVEGLYNWWRKSGKSKQAFIKENRAHLDSIIKSILEGETPKPKPDYLWIAKRAVR